MEIKACRETLDQSVLNEKDSVPKEELFTILNPLSTNSKMSECWRNAVPTSWGDDALCGWND